MKIILLLVFIFISVKSFSQDFYLGRTYDEIGSSLNSPQIGTFGGKKCFNQTVDSNTREVYIFDYNNICIEYIRIIKNTDINNIEEFYLRSYIKGNDNIYIDYSGGLVAMVSPSESSSENLFEIRFRKNKFQ